MATTTNTIATPSRHDQLAALLAFAAENGYQGHTDKLEKVKEQWTAKGANSATHQANVGYAELIKAAMEPGKTYTNEDIRGAVDGLPVGTRGVVEPSKVNSIMNAGLDAGMFTVETLGKMRFYALA